MNRLMKLLGVLFVVVFIHGHAGATATLSLVPDFQKIHPPQNLFVDVIVSGLQPPGGTSTLLGAFDLTFQFNPNVFQFLPTLSSVGTGLGNPADPLQTVIGMNIPAPGTFNFFEVSLLEGSASTCIFCIGPYLDDLQSDTFSLATLAFSAPGSASPSPPFTNFLITDAILSDANGNEIANPIIRNTSVAVPEPSSLLFLMAGLVALGFVRRGNVLS